MQTLMLSGGQEYIYIYFAQIYQLDLTNTASCDSNVLFSTKDTYGLYLMYMYIYKQLSYVEGKQRSEAYLAACPSLPHLLLLSIWVHVLFRAVIIYLLLQASEEWNVTTHTPE